MTKVIYNSKEIELVDELEDGYMELDMLTDNDKKTNNLDDTMELKPVNLEDTMEIKVIDLDDTQELNFGDIHE